MAQAARSLGPSVIPASPAGTQQHPTAEGTLPPRPTRDRKLPVPYPRRGGVSDPPVFRAPHHPTAPRWGVTWSPESPLFTLAWGRGRFGRLRPKSVRGPPVEPTALADRNLKCAWPVRGSLKPAAPVPARHFHVLRNCLTNQGLGCRPRITGRAAGQVRDIGRIPIASSLDHRRVLHLHSPG